MAYQGLQLSQSQQLQMVLAPQLRQSLEMLQLPVMELRTLIQQEMEQNPTIEDVPSEQETIEIEPGGKSEVEDAQELAFEKEYEAMARLDDEWRDYFFQDLQNTSYSSEAEERRQYMFDSIPQRESLQEHLVNQLQLTGFPEQDLRVGELIIGSINDDGYLMLDIEELAQSASCDTQHLSDILSVIQDFHPTGVGSSNLRECLLIQLERLGNQDTLAYRIVDDYLEKLGGRKLNDIARSLGVSVEEVQQAAKMIATLDPKPGLIYAEDVATYVLPEVVVQKVNGKYVILMDDDQLPHVRISRHYRRLLESDTTSREVKSYVRERIRSGAFLIKSIHQRQKTIHKIASEIVANQEDFLDHGISRLKPLTMAEVADKVGVHETTVSRAVAAKYMQTPQGMFEMKYFFTPGIKTTDGTQVSNKTVKDIIANLVAKEDPAKPLSDQEIVKILREDGIKIARRTVAKYRLVLRIPASHMRKVY
jgi:RNA polymerase sigma-54 factor